MQINKIMDEDFLYFYEKKGFGPAEHVQTVPPATLEGFKNIVPERMLSYWTTYGFASYAKGLFWTVNPAVYAPLVPIWLESTPLFTADQYAVIGRGAFGQLFLWGAKSGLSVTILALRGMIFPNDQSARISAGQAELLSKSFFSGRDKKNLDQKDDDGKPLFERALRSLGQLMPDEMYGFEPALALGGVADLSHLRKLKVLPHLTILSQLERTVMRDIVQDAKRAGL